MKRFPVLSCVLTALTAAAACTPYGSVHSITTNETTRDARLDTGLAVVEVTDTVVDPGCEKDCIEVLHDWARLLTAGDTLHVDAMLVDRRTDSLLRGVPHATGPWHTEKGRIIEADPERTSVLLREALAVPPVHYSALVRVPPGTTRAAYRRP